MPPFVCLRATLTGEGERLGHVYHDGLTKMGVWGAHAVRTRRRWVLGAHAPCRSDEHGRLWCIFGVTLARNDVCGASDVPQTQVFASCVRRMCHKWNFPPFAPSTRATNEAPCRLSMPSTKHLRHSRAVCAPYIEVDTPLAAFNPEKPCGGGGRRHHPVRQIHREEMSS